MPCAAAADYVGVTLAPYSIGIWNCAERGGPASQRALLETSLFIIKSTQEFKNLLELWLTVVVL